MSRVSFCTAVTYGDPPKPTCQFLLETVDSYFYLGGKKVEVLSKKKYDRQEVIWVSKKPSLLSTCAKVVSYLTIIIPLIMLAVKLVLRATHSFYLVDLEALEDCEIDYGDLDRCLSKIPANSDSTTPELQPLSLPQQPDPLPEPSQPTLQQQPNPLPELSHPTLLTQAPLILEPLKPPTRQPSPLVDLQVDPPNENELIRSVTWLVKRKQYKDAFNLIDRTQLPVNIHHLRLYIETSQQGEQAIRLIKEDKVEEALSILNGLPRSETKDAILEQAIVDLAKKKFFSEAIDLLLNHTFSADSNKQDTIKALVRELKLEVKTYENNNKIELANFFLAGEYYSIAHKIAASLPNREKEELKEKINLCERGELKIPRKQIRSIQQIPVMTSF